MQKRLDLRKCSVKRSPYHFIFFHVLLNPYSTDFVHVFIEINHGQERAYPDTRTISSVIVDFLSLFYQPFLEFLFINVTQHLELVLFHVKLFDTQVLVEVFVDITSNNEIH